MPQKVSITTGARLHFGLLSHGPDRGGRFGGAGVMIDSPGFELSAELSHQSSCTAPVPFEDRVDGFVRCYWENGPEGRRQASCRWHLTRVIPSHLGLGSGTQLGMAVAQALSMLAGDDRSHPVTLAQKVGRGLRSSVGIHGFGQGGFIIDAGKTAQDSIGTLHSRIDFPEHWRFVLAAPRGISGLSGDAELKAFAQLPPMANSTTNRLWDILQAELLPGITASEFAACAEALYRYGQIAGEYFAPLQNGVYADPLMARLADHLRREGWQGVGQSSWGPTIFALCRSLEEAESLRDSLAGDARWQTCEFRIAAPMNTGAIVRTT